MYEIERKWIVDPDEFAEMHQQGVVNRKYVIFQTYLVNERNLAVRIRLQLIEGEPETAVLCIKTPTDNPLVRTEVERPIDVDIAWAAVHHGRGYIQKVRYVFEDYEIDVFGDKLQGLILAEREYQSVDEAEADVLPFFCVRDVTEDTQFINAVLVHSYYDEDAGRVMKLDESDLP